MPTLTITRGLPGSGKSTWAMQQTDENTVRANRDDLRFELYNKYSGLSKVQEREISRVQQERVRQALESGKNVIVDDTNLNSQTVSNWRLTAEDYDGKVQFEIKDFDVNADECIKRDDNRRQEGKRGTGPAVIKNMEERYFRNGHLPRLPPALYREIPTPPKPEDRRQGIIFDIDGTLCDVRSVRHHLVTTETKKRNFHLFHTDSINCPPHPYVVEILRQAQEEGLAIVIVTAREQKYQDLTERWLAKNGIEYDHIYTRPLGDHRPDYEVKKEILARVLKHVDVLSAVDDNPAVLQLWKEENINAVVVPGFDDPVGAPDDVYEIVSVDSPFRSGKCLRCGRKMTRPGYLGPECARKYSS